MYKVSLRTLALTCVTALSSISVSAMDQRDFSLNEGYPPQKQISSERHHHGLIQEILPNRLYVSSGVAATGEPIYFGMEFVDQDNEINWEIYQKQSYYYKSNFYFSSTVLSKERRQDYFSDSGYEQAEYEILCNNIVQKASQRTREEMSELQDSYKAGFGAFGVSADAGCYVSYISKEPVISYFTHPNDPVSFKGYHEGYKNLLMSVRCKDIANTAVYNNRGISRGLKSFLDGGYGGLALKLHGFTGAVFETMGKTHMSVAPLPKMLEILKAKIPEDKLLIGNNIPEELNHFEGMQGYHDRKCVIDIQTLKSCFP